MWKNLLLVTALLTAADTVMAATLHRTATPASAIALDAAQLAAADPVLASAGFVDRVIRQQPVAAYLSHFQALDPAQLERALVTQPQRLAFWINIYNGYTQHFLQTNPAPYLEKRSRYFAAKQIPLAGELLSLGEIEHGILRRGATTLSLGYVRLPALHSAFVRRFMVAAVDYRIHFALNCGARSCPPVMPYRAETLNAQLDAISRDYLTREARYDAANNNVQVPALLRWFSADFDGGGDASKRLILRRFGVLPANAGQPGVVYRDYDWTLDIRNYAEFRDGP